MFLVVCDKRNNTLTIKDFFQSTRHLETLQKVYDRVYGKTNVVVKKCPSEIFKKCKYIDLAGLIGHTVNYDFHRN